MNYQQAKEIREKSYISHLTDKLSEGRGIGSSIKATLSDKSKASSMRYKEMFDPMNIAKFMTGGSKFAPALLGGMTGRSQQDIQYFSGSKAKSAGSTATKIDKLESDNKVLDILVKVYELIKSANENDIKRKQQENNLKEEQELERERRHKSLIEAITGSKQTGTATPTATKANDNNGLLGLVMGMVSGLIGDAIKGVMSIVSGISSFVSLLTKSFGGIDKIASLLFNLGRFLMFNPLGLAIVAGSGIAYAVYQLWKQSNEEQTQTALAGNAQGQYGATTQLPSYDQEQDDKRLKAKASAFDKKGIANSSLDELTAKHQLMIEYGDPRIFIKKGTADDTQKSKGKLLDDIETEIKARNTIPELMGKSVTPKTPTVVESQPTSKPAMPRQEAGPELMNQISAASGKLNTVTSENLQLNLPSTPDSVVESQITNNTNISSTKSQRPKGAIPSVRNTEDSFQRMLLNSLRVV